MHNLSRWLWRIKAETFEILHTLQPVSSHEQSSMLCVYQCQVQECWCKCHIICRLTRVQGSGMGHGIPTLTTSHRQTDSPWLRLMWQSTRKIRQTQKCLNKRQSLTLTFSAVYSHIQTMIHSLRILLVLLSQVNQILSLPPPHPTPGPIQWG